jgi:hypothetical protein
MYFAVYFCALHSIRHFTSTMRAVPNGQRALGVAVVLSGIVTLAAVAATLFGPAGPVADPTEQGIRVIFIGLAALTVPHMILADRFRRECPSAPPLARTGSVDARRRDHPGRNTSRLAEDDVRDPA